MANRHPHDTRPRDDGQDEPRREDRSRDSYSDRSIRDRDDRSGQREGPVFDRGRTGFPIYRGGSADRGWSERASDRDEERRGFDMQDRDWGYRRSDYMGSRERPYEGRPEGFQGGGYQGYEGRTGLRGAVRFDDEGAGRSHRGRGPKNYRRSDARIHEDVSDRLTDDPQLDASQVEVSVSEREVTLSGEVGSKRSKRRAEECAEAVAGVEHVQNNLRVARSGRRGGAEDEAQ